MHVEEPAREGFLYHLWLNRDFTQQELHTINGIPVEILEKGERNFDAGPDFLNALVRIGGDLLRGSVEIHPIAGDWYAHGHHRDPRYNEVILHLITMQCPPEFRTLAADGKAIPILNLDQFLEKPAEELEDEDAFEPILPEQCALAALPLPKLNRIIEKYADLRFRLKSERFLEQTALHSWDQVFYLHLCSALGYAKNQAAFVRLAQNLPVEKIWQLVWNDPPEQAYLKTQAFLFGTAGLLPSQKLHPEPSFSNYVQNLETIWQAFPLRLKLDLLPTEAWQFFRLRPQNFPTRRIAAAAACITRFSTDGFLQTCLKTLQRCANYPHKWVQELENLFLVDADYFWQMSYHLYENTHQNLPEKKLLGMERARDIVINIVLPALTAFAQQSRDNQLCIIVQQLYTSYPKCSENSWTRQMRAKLPATGLRENCARFQQGLLQLQTMCSKNDCQACVNNESL